MRLELFGFTKGSLNDLIAGPKYQPGGQQGHQIFHFVQAIGKMLAFAAGNLDPGPD